MPSTPTTRRAAGLLAGGVALAALTGCTLTSNNVSCSSDGSCTVKLTGDGSEAEILGTTLSLGKVQDGRASMSVAGASVSCAEGESVSAGSLQLQCTTVTEDSVELTASVN
jgi:hypothetical protein